MLHSPYALLCEVYTNLWVGFQNRSSVERRKGKRFSSSKELGFVVCFCRCFTHVFSPVSRPLALQSEFFFILFSLRTQFVEETERKYWNLLQAINPYTSVIFTQSFIRLLNHGWKSEWVSEMEREESVTVGTTMK